MHVNPSVHLLMPGVALKLSRALLRDRQDALQVVDAVKAPRKQNGAPVFQALFLLREVSTKQVRAPCPFCNTLDTTMGLQTFMKVPVSSDSSP